MTPLALWLAGCAGWTPTAEPVDSRVVGASLDVVTVEIDVRVDNPWPVSVTVVDHAWTVTAAGHPVLTAGADAPIVVPGRDEATFTVPLTLSWPALRAAAGAADREIPWRLDGALTVATPLGDRVVPVGIGGSLPLLEIPTVTVADLRFADEGLGLAVDLRLDTARGAPWGVTHARCAVLIDDRPLAQAVARTRAEGDATVLTFEATVAPSVGWDGARRLWAGEPVPAAFVLEAGLVTPFGELPLEARADHALRWPSDG